MTIHIELRPDEEHLLRERARQTGRDLAEYIHLVLKEHIEAPSNVLPEGAPKSFAEVLTPVWEGFRHSGMSEDEAAGFLEDELKAARRERKRQP